jgi:hypothetical protein
MYRYLYRRQYRNKASVTSEFQRLGRLKDDDVGHKLVDLSYTTLHSSPPRPTSNSMTTIGATPGSRSSSHTAIQTYHTYIPSPLPTAPSFDLHLTRFRDTLLVWVGTTTPSDGSALAEEAGEKRIAADWSVAMPANRVCPPNENRRRG